MGLKTELISPSTVVNPKKDPRINKLDNAA